MQGCECLTLSIDKVKRSIFAIHGIAVMCWNMKNMEKKYEPWKNLECKICLRQFQSDAELENHKIIEHQRNYPPLGVG